MNSSLGEKFLLLLKGQERPLTHVIVIRDVPVNNICSEAFNCVVKLVLHQMTTNVRHCIMWPMGVLARLGLEVLDNSKTVLESLSV